ncbi:DMT family transporter [Amphritea balenae]|uniref:DMT family transporter n=2 Tax=Amphritea balenae TaxID=452629 RepID=A0A3P1T088_9GAMM|nr:DMT family transporter [Amphritea balenae]
MSLTAAVIKYTSEFVSVELIVLVQYLICVAVMLPWLAAKGLKQLKTERPLLHLLRGTAGWLCFYSYYLALNEIPMVEASLLRNSAPLVVPVVVLIWLKYRMPWRNWLPVLLGFIGIALVLKPDGSSLSLGHLIAFTSAIALAASIVTTRVLTKTEPTNRILFYYFSISALLSVPLAITQWQSVPLFTLPLMLIIGLSIWVIMWLYTQAYKYAKATVIAPLSYFGVLFTGLLGWYFWQQVPDTFAIAGAILIISGGIGSVYLGKEKG